MTPEAAVNSADFRRWMSRFATGVTVVTTREASTDYGLTVNAFLSISLRPPLVLVSLTTDADTTPAVQRSRKFAVNLLASHQRALSERFAQTITPVEKFQGLELETTSPGLPLLVGTLGALECVVEDELPVADHILFIGRVTRLHPGIPHAPLIFHDGEYTSTGAPDARSVSGMER